MKYVGVLFIGYYLLEVIGDYVVGLSYVLFINRIVRFINGLLVNDFLIWNMVIYLLKDMFE